jgi:hypothetical protein
LKCARVSAVTRGVTITWNDRDSVPLRTFQGRETWNR